jgi:hypothetical protein
MTQPLTNPPQPLIIAGEEFPDWRILGCTATRWTKEAADGLVDQRFHVLAFGEAYLARVTRAELYDLGASVQITAEVETPEEEAIPEPLELAAEENYREYPVLADDDCLRLTPTAECPAAGSPRCVDCVWRPADEVPDGQA